MFGRGYEEIGSSDKGLILKNSGKVKIQWGKKLIDLLDSNGNLNVKVSTLIKEISSEADIKQDGFYYFNGSLIAKVGDNIIELTSESGTTYVSFIQEQEATDKQKYTALQNIGFIYPTQKDSNIYPTNGIIYIEDSQSLFIVKDGTLSKYIAPIPNPFTKQFIIQKSVEDSSEGALVIQGEGKANGLLFDNLKIYAKGVYSVLEANKEFQFYISNNPVAVINLNGIETDQIQSFGADNNSGYRIWQKDGKYILDIDKINVREAEDVKDVFENEVYSSRFHLNSFELISYEDVNNYTRLQKIYYDLLENSETLTNNSIIHIPIKVVECTKTSIIDEDGVVIPYLIPKNYVKEINSEGTVQIPKESFYRLELVLKNDGVLYPVIKSKNTVSNTTYIKYSEFSPYIEVYPYLGAYEDAYECLRFDEESEDPIYYVIVNQNLQDALKGRTLYVVSENNSNSRLYFDFKEPQIILKQNAQFENLPHQKKIITKIGDISEYETHSDDLTNKQGLFSNKNIFIGGEFRHPLPTYTGILDEEGNVEEIKEKEIEYKNKDFPRYSTELCKQVNEFITNDEIILPRKYAQKVTIEDFTDIIPTIGTETDEGTTKYNMYELPEDTVLYDGKLILLKISGKNSYGSRIKIVETIYPDPTEEDPEPEPIINKYYYPVLIDGKEIKENVNFKGGSVILIKYVNKKFNYLSGNPSKSTIITDYTNISASSATYTINEEFIDGQYVLIKITGTTSSTIKINTVIDGTTTSYNVKYNDGTSLKESDFDQNTVIMLKFDNSKFVYYLGDKKPSNKILDRTNVRSTITSTYQSYSIDDELQAGDIIFLTNYSNNQISIRIIDGNSKSYVINSPQSEEIYLYSDYIVYIGSSNSAKIIHYNSLDKNTLPSVGLSTSSDTFGTPGTGMTTNVGRVKFFDSDVITVKKGVYSGDDNNRVDLQFILSDTFMTLLNDLCTATDVTNPFS